VDNYGAMMAIKDAFIYACIPIFAVYFYQFKKTIELLDDLERQRYVKKAGQPWWINIIIALVIAVIIFAKNTLVTIIIGILWLTDIVWSTKRHNKKLIELNFDPMFRKKLIKISYLSVIGIAMFLIGTALQTYKP